MSYPVRRRSERRPVLASRTELIILAGGLIAAVVSGVAAYNTVGPYGEGPFNAGLYRAEDPETGVQLVYREVRTADGAVLRYLFDDTSRTLREVRVVRDGQGTSKGVALRLNDGSLSIEGATRSMATDPATGLLKVGFSLRDNGIIDAWEYRDAARRLHKIEVSRRQDGVVDRWEFYEHDQLARVEEDDNRDGRVDRWLTYEAGILVHEARDRNGDGRPDTSHR